MASWVSAKYSKKMLASASREFAAQGSIRLVGFLSEEGLANVSKGSWKRECDPLKHSYYWSSKILPAFFASDVFEAISAIVGASVSSKSLVHASFGKGDYSVLRDDLAGMKGIVMLLDVNSLQEEWGGYSVFLRGNEEVLRVVPTKNTLTLVESNDLREFVKYVNHHATRGRIVIAGVLKRND